MKHLIAILSCSLLFAACEKEPEESFSNTPEINIVNVSPNSVKAYLQNVKIVLGYKDGDGDLGWNDPDKYSVFVLDSRLSEEDEYHLSPLAPEGANIAITGQVTIDLHNTFLLGTGGAAENITYQVRIRDRAGNWSNTVTTPSIRINP